MARPSTYNFTIYQGSTHQETFYGQDASGAALDLSSYHVRLIAKIGQRSISPVIELNSVDDTDNLTEPTATGYWTFTLSSTETAALDFETATYVMELYDEGSPVEVVRIAQGKIRVSKEVTS